MYVIAGHFPGLMRRIAPKKVTLIQKQHADYQSPNPKGTIMANQPHNPEPAIR